jgi:preprotein translocase subunit YajC
VVTLGGIHGTIHEIQEDKLLVDLDRTTRVTIDRDAISMDSSMRAQGKDPKKA